MSTNENVNAPYEVNGKNYKSFNEYFIAQAVAAQQEYNYDGYRWDWYGLPETYVCDGLAGTGNFLMKWHNLSINWILLLRK